MGWKVKERYQLFINVFHHGVLVLLDVNEYYYTRLFRILTMKTVLGKGSGIIGAI